MTQAEAPTFAPRPLASRGRTLPGPRGVISSLRGAGHMSGDLLSYLCELERLHAGREMRPVGFRVLGQPMCLVVHPVQVKEVLTQSELFTRFFNPYFNAFRMALGRNIITVPRDEYKPIKRRTAGYFARPQLERYGRVVARVLDEVALPMCARKARAGESLDIFEEMLGVSSRAVFQSFVGDRADDAPPEVYRALDGIFCFVRRHAFSIWLPPLFVPTAENRDLRADLERVRAYLRPMLAGSGDADTMLGDILRTHTDPAGRVHEGHVLDEIIGNLVGGSETTIILMAWVLYYVVQHPEVEARLLAEIERVLGERAPQIDDLRSMPFLLCVINEALRLRSPAYLGIRVAERDTDIGGYAVERQTMICVSQHITHRHPLVWKDPLEFQPDRFSPSSPEAPANRRSEMPFFPFGGGGYACLGMNFAVNEAALMAAMLLRRFRFTPVDPAGFASVGIDARLTLRPDRPLRVQVHARREP